MVKILYNIADSPDGFFCSVIRVTCSVYRLLNVYKLFLFFFFFIDLWRNDKKQCFIRRYTIDVFRSRTYNNYCVSYGQV